jgi:hypothetical protein
MSGVSPGRRAAALAIDLILGGLASAAAGLLAGGWLLLRTGWGRDDVPSGDATFAGALLLAATPAWLAWSAARLVLRGATPGQARARLLVTGSRGRRLLRLACHPVSVPGWSWLAILAAVATFDVLAVTFAVVGVTVLAGGLGTAVTALARPQGRGLHDVIAGTRLAPA